MLTKQDKIECKEIARAINKEVLVEHVQACPYGRSLLKLTFISIGIAIGSGLASGGIIVAVLKMFGA